MKISPLFVTILVGCTPVSQYDTSEDVQALLLADPVFESTVEHLHSNGAELLWSDAIVDGEATHGHLTVMIPVSYTSRDTAELLFERAPDGATYVSLTESPESPAKNDALSHLIPPPPPGGCGVLDIRATCGIAYQNGTCENGTLHYEKKYYHLYYYTNGRALGGYTGESTFSCGTPLHTHPHCSSTCVPY